MTNGRRVAMLGFDAMDPALTRAMAADGRLPTFARLLSQSGYLGTIPVCARGWATH